MRILRFNDNRIGVLNKMDHVVDISEVISHREIRGPAAIDELIGNFAVYRPQIEDKLRNEPGVPLASVKLLSPLERPVRVVAAFANFLDKPNRTADSIALEFFHKSPEMVGPDGEVVLPDISAIAEFHAEAELAFIIGKRAKNVPLDRAMDHVFGYVPFFDISARGMTRKSQLLPKGMDTFTVCGPWITTIDEVPDPHDLIVRSWVSGEPRQDYNTSAMAHKIPKQVEWLSRFIQLQPGTVVATGTHHDGLGPINVGDTLEIEITGLGRARFVVTGDSPHKDIGFRPGAQPGVQQLVLTNIR